MFTDIATMSEAGERGGRADHRDVELRHSASASDMAALYSPPRRVRSTLEVTGCVA
jgi:hypothetical protein